MPQPLASTVRTIFADLLQKVDTATPDGSVYTHRQGDSEYLYVRERIGQRRVDRYLGRADDPAVRATADRLAAGSAQAAERRRTVRLLRGQGLAGPDDRLGPLIQTVAHAHLFDEGAVLVGTAAYLMMEPLVGTLLPAPTMMTDDLDLATLSLTLAARPPATMLDILRRADPSFDGVMQLDGRTPPSRFRSATGYLVDLVTPTLRQTDTNPMPLDRLEARAAPLPYLRWLIESPVATIALWGSGVAVRIPQPPRYAVHKLILAQKRFSGSRAKRGKDLAQASALIAALEQTDPFAIEDAMADARAKGKRGWSDPIDRSLAELERGLHSTR